MSESESESLLDDATSNVILFVIGPMSIGNQNTCKTCKRPAEKSAIQHRQHEYDVMNMSKNQGGC